MSERKYNGGKWTRARFNSFVTAALRSARWPAKYDVKKEAFLGKKINSKTGRMCSHYRCAICQEEHPSGDIEVNHIEAVTPAEGFTTWDSFIERLFCEADNLEVLCTTCHKKISEQQRSQRKAYQDHAKELTYGVWKSMKQRCYNPKSQRYYTHGGRGITVCDRWKDSFENFLEDMGPKPSGYSIEREDNDGNYEPNNCRWATPKEQANNRRTNILITYNGDTLTVKQWADSLGVSLSTMRKRLSKWPIEEALTLNSQSVDTIDVELKNEILLKHLVGGVSQEKLAKEYGVSQQVISKWKLANKNEESK